MILSRKRAQLLLSVSRAITLNQLYNKKSGADYEKIQDAVEKVISGHYKIVRLTPEAEAGRIEGGPRLIGASLLLGAKESASPTGVKELDQGYRIINTGFQERRKVLVVQENIIEDYAKHVGMWIPQDDPRLSRKRKIGEGLESYVYHNPDALTLL